MTSPVVIIGTGLAGYNLAREFRKLDAQTPLLLITADDGRSYSKPMLSTGFAKQKDADGLCMAEPGAMAEQLNAEIRTHTRISGIDPGHKRLWIGEEAVEYRDLVLAWGAQTVQVPIEGDGGDRVFPINDTEDYARFRAAAVGKQRVLILGAGLIGCEFANDMSLAASVSMWWRRASKSCRPCCTRPLPLPCRPGCKAGRALSLGPVLTRLQQVGQGLEAHLSDGSVIACDLVVSAIGLRPRTDTAAAAGLQTNRGVCVDRQLRTSHANIFALGDCAEVDGINLLYVMPLMSCARATAQTTAGKPTTVAYGPMPITVKTPACPLVVSPPPPGHEGTAGGRAGQ